MAAMSFAGVTSARYRTVTEISEANENFDKLNIGGWAGTAQLEDKIKGTGSGKEEIESQIQTNG